MNPLPVRAAYHEAGHCVAALAFGIPIIRVTIKNETPHLLRGHYRAQHDAGLECMATLCLSGPAAEEYFCGSIEVGADRIDVEMVRRCLARRFEPLRISAEIARLRNAAERLVRTHWAQHRIEMIADALVRHGTLTGADISAL
jgi:hypothetical protein